MTPVTNVRLASLLIMMPLLLITADFVLLVWYVLQERNRADLLGPEYPGADQRHAQLRVASHRQGYLQCAMIKLASSISKSYSPENCSGYYIEMSHQQSVHATSCNSYINIYADCITLINIVNRY